jgi:hypothetical protein
MHSGRAESGVSTIGVVGQVLARRPSVKALAEERRVEPASRAAVAVVATEGDAAAKSPPEPVRSVVRDVLSRFLELNESVSELVNRYVEVFAEQPDRLDAWRLKHIVGPIADTITSLDGAVALLLRESEEARVGPAEPDCRSLEHNRRVLETVHGSLTGLADNASALVASLESRQEVFERLRALMDDAWRATTMLFKIATKVVTRLLDQVPQWTASSAAISEIVLTSARDTKPESSVQTAVTK